jgi:excisionase family DNA binding protein
MFLTGPRVRFIRVDMNEAAQNNSDVEKRAYSVREVADALGITPKAVREKIIRGEIQGRQLGRTWLVSKAWFDAWLAELEGDEQGNAE